ncbi:MAG: prepilin-type N-terminal cleavage/methylation domain-containing protein [Gemmatimonadetes bacterium]|nr:prepilin-type N-terminal cleavage/methylation domain-containing protein [Gemmatimonadota bacterium]
MTGRRSRAGACGFTIPELVIALTIFAVGVLGSAGLLALAARTLARADARAWAAAVAAEIADSLALVPAPASGERLLPRGAVAWTVRHEGPVTRVTLRVRVSGAGLADSVSTVIVVADSVAELGARATSVDPDSPSSW